MKAVILTSNTPTCAYFKLQISIVSQEPVLFNCSLEENIAYGCHGKASISDIETVAVSLSKHA